MIQRPKAEERKIILLGPCECLMNFKEMRTFMGLENMPISCIYF